MSDDLRYLLSLGVSPEDAGRRLGRTERAVTLELETKEEGHDDKH